MATNANVPTGEPPVTPAIYREMGVSDSEYEQIIKTLGRTPTYTEIGMYSVMWSEHCGYKYSRPVLKAFAQYKKAQESGELENAGVVPLDGTEYGIVFKMESHNHPSAVEPYQGAATGVGGILRDIFTMGARPVANLNSLRFGPITGDDPAVTRNKYLFEHVVKGVGDYGNCLAGDELIIWQDLEERHYGTIENLVEEFLHGGEASTEVPSGVTVLSIDFDKMEICWKPIRRVFRRNTNSLLRITATGGRSVVVTPDHPMLTLCGEPGNYSQRIRLAQQLSEGDKLLCITDTNLASGSDSHEQYERLLSADAYGNAALRLRYLEREGKKIDDEPWLQDDDGTNAFVIAAVTDKEIIEGDAPVYDVEVEGTHLFVTSDGIVTHNCVGVPTVGGEIYFHPCYNGNPLVNAMSVGIVRRDKIASAKASGVGNPVLYVGSATGRDGIHGATFASVELTEESEAKRANVQVGDPFTEKLLIEATLEALATGGIVGIQDMGAAGLTCGTCEMAAKGSLGMEIDVQAVPRRELGMTAYETMLSESQERMLAVVEKGREAEVAAVFHKWGLNAAYIGFVTDTGRVVVKDNGEVKADIPAKSLADDCPTYFLDAAEPEYIARVQSADFSALPEPDDYNAVLLKLLASPSIASKRWVWEQYDTMVQTQTEVLPGRGDAAVLSLREANGARIAVTTDCNPRFVYLDPFVGAQIAVAEAARNISCVGAVPRAVTDCLNFPSPEKPSGFWQFTQAVNGMAAACEAFGTPVVSGNVSFYNETPENAIYPTPTVGMVGVFAPGVTPCTMDFKSDGDLIYLLRPTGSGNVTGIAGSEYLSLIHGQDTGKPALDIAGELAVQAVTREAIAAGLLHSAHDCADGGTLVAIAESCLAGNRGAEVRVAITDFDDPATGKDQPWSAILFGEATSRILVSVTEGDKQNALLDIAERHGIEALFIGQVKKTERLDVAGLVDVPLFALRDAYEGAIPRAMVGKT